MRIIFTLSSAACAVHQWRYYNKSTPLYSWVTIQLPREPHGEPPNPPIYFDTSYGMFATKIFNRPKWRSQVVWVEGWDSRKLFLCLLKLYSKQTNALEIGHMPYKSECMGVFSRCNYGLRMWNLFILSSFYTW